MSGNNTLLKINKAPVKTWSWLNVNDINIKDFNIEINKEFKNTLIENTGDNRVTVNDISDTNRLSMLDNHEYSGVSTDCINECDKHNNAGVVIHAHKNNPAVNLAADTSAVNERSNVLLEYKADKSNDVIIDNNLIIADENSSVSVILKYSSMDNSQGYHNGLTRIYAKANSRVRVVKIQDFNNSTLNLDSNLVVLEDGAQVTVVNVDLGGKNSVINWQFELSGNGSSAKLNNAYIGEQDKVLDFNYLMKHCGIRTTSLINSKGALLDNSAKTFKGTLDFKKGAKRAKGSESEYTMLLSKSAKSKAVPYMLCEEEDVEGSHSASAGKIDENKLFYIMSRGFSESEAKRLIIEAAISPLLDDIDDEKTRDDIKQNIGRRLIND